MDIDKESQERLVSELERMKKDERKLGELVDRNWHRWLLKYWSYIVIIVIVSVVVTSLIANILSLYLSQIITPYEPAAVDEMRSLMLTPSTLIIGISICFMPVISFFFVNDLKEGKEKSIEQWKKKETELKENKEIATEENLKILNGYYTSNYTIWVHIICGVTHYARTFLIVSIVSMILLLEFFIILPSGYLIAFIICLLASILSGILPILGLAFYQPVLRFRNHITARAHY